MRPIPDVRRAAIASSWGGRSHGVRSSPTRARTPPGRATRGPCPVRASARRRGVRGPDAYLAPGPPPPRTRRLVIAVAMVQTLSVWGTGALRCNGSMRSASVAANPRSDVAGLARAGKSQPVRQEFLRPPRPAVFRGAAPPASRAVGAQVRSHAIAAPHERTDVSGLIRGAAAASHQAIADGAHVSVLVIGGVYDGAVAALRLKPDGRWYWVRTPYR